MRGYGWFELLLILCASYVFLWGYRRDVPLLYPSIAMVLGPIYVWFRQGWIRSMLFAMLHSCVLCALLFYGAYSFAFPFVGAMIDVTSKTKMIVSYALLFLNKIIF